MSICKLFYKNLFIIITFNVKFIKIYNNKHVELQMNMHIQLLFHTHLTKLEPSLTCGKKIDCGSKNPCD